MDEKIAPLLKNRSEIEGQEIIKAYNFAKLAHKDQKRFSGDPYITHPLAVAEYLNSLNLDTETIVASLLHDIIEDTPIDSKQIEDEFGPIIASLVEGATKVSSVRLNKNRVNNKNETTGDTHSPYLFDRQLSILRKMFLAMAKDLRVVLIKLADRRHNMQTLQYVPKEKHFRIAQETLEIYAPLAHRLGMGELKGELEDLAFPYAYPEEYVEFQKLLGDTIDERKEYIKTVKQELSETLNLFNIEHTIDGRIKHFYSLYKKMIKKSTDIDQIYDLVACRVMVNTVEECYMVLGLVHQLWKPLKGKIKDYIAIPKPNGYQSIHTTVFGPGGHIAEIQIRTWEMHEQAEKGVAAHWHYTGQLHDSEVAPNNFYAPTEETQWVTKMLEMLDGLAKKTISPEDAKIDFFQDRIFVFTPKGDVHELPAGSTPIDFAYCVHSDIGNSCSGAKVNGKLVNLNTILINGDMVDIMTSKKSKPKGDWLKCVKTSHAKSVIKHYLKNN